MYIDPNTGGSLVSVSLFCFAGFVLCLIIFAATRLKKSKKEASQADFAYNHMLRKLPPEKQLLFLMQYSSVKKNPTIAVLLALFLGGLGLHKFYMGKIGLGILFLIFCWTSIPSIIAFFEAFVISGQVAKYNQVKAREISSMLIGIYPA